MNSKALANIALFLALIAMVTVKAGGARLCRASGARRGSLVLILETVESDESFLLMVRDCRPRRASEAWVLGSGGPSYSPPGEKWEG